MKMNVYQTPEMEVVELKTKMSMLVGSDPTAGGSGSFDPSEDPNE